MNGILSQAIRILLESIPLQTVAKSMHVPVYLVPPYTLAFVLYLDPKGVKNSFDFSPNCSLCRFNFSRSILTSHRISYILSCFGLLFFSFHSDQLDMYTYRMSMTILADSMPM